MLALTRERLLDHLRQVPTLATRYSDRDPAFVDGVIAWLEEVEASLLQLRSPLVALAAAQRGEIIGAKDGFRKPGISSAMSGRKATRIAATLALSRTENLLRQNVTEIDGRLGEAREKLVQLLAVATSENPIPMPPTEPRQLWLHRVWRGLNVNAGTQGMYTYLSSALSSSDRLYLLEEVLSNLLSAQAEPEATLASVEAERPAAKRRPRTTRARSARKPKPKRRKDAATGKPRKPARKAKKRPRGPES